MAGVLVARMLPAILSAFVGAILGFAAAGFGAAILLASTLGDHDGGSSMGGFFIFGPIGAISGALLGAGVALHFRSRRPWSTRLTLSSVAVAFLGGLLLVITAFPNREPSYSYVIEFQLEVPAEALTGVTIPSPNAMWGAAGAGSDDKPISQFAESKCEQAACLLHGSVAALGALNAFHIRATIGPKQYRFPLEIPTVVNAPQDWSAWHQTEGGQSRWRIITK